MLFAASVVHHSSGVAGWGGGGGGRWAKSGWDCLNTWISLMHTNNCDCSLFVIAPIGHSPGRPFPQVHSRDTAEAL